MSKVINVLIKAVLSHCLLLAVAMVFLAAVILMPISWTSAGITAEAVADDEPEDEYWEEDDTENPWFELLWKAPTEQEIIPILDPAEGIEKKYFTTGTNDFGITIERDADGMWWGPNGELGKAIATTEYEFLKEALDREWELKMQLPDEVLVILNSGGKVGVAVADAQETNLKGGTNAEKVATILKKKPEIEGVPGNPSEARKFINKHHEEYGLELGQLQDPNSKLKISKLFDLPQSNEVLQYRIVGKFLVIKGYPKTRLRANFYYSNIITGFEEDIPLADDYCGASSHDIYKQTGLSYSGHTSTIMYDSALLEEGLSLTQEEALREELKISEGAGYLHFKQIQNENADGYLQGYGKNPFWFLSWADSLGKPYISNQMRIGNGNFKKGGGISLWWWFPMELTF